MGMLSMQLPCLAAPCLCWASWGRCPEQMWWDAAGMGKSCSPPAHGNSFMAKSSLGHKRATQYFQDQEERENTCRGDHDGAAARKAGSGLAPQLPCQLQVPATSTGKGAPGATSAAFSVGPSRASSAPTGLSSGSAQAARTDGHSYRTCPYSRPKRSADRLVWVTANNSKNCWHRAEKAPLVPLQASLLLPVIFECFILRQKTRWLNGLSAIRARARYLGCNINACLQNTGGVRGAVLAQSSSSHRALPFQMDGKRETCGREELLQGSNPDFKLIYTESDSPFAGEGGIWTRTGQPAKPWLSRHITAFVLAGLPRCDSWAICPVHSFDPSDFRTCEGCSPSQLPPTNCVEKSLCYILASMDKALGGSHPEPQPGPMRCWL
ncbi:hypothetical protein Anapl_17857 [Anas platyrhynchos]|uniref:Uncharacterized protein n=1 Tax=Anas platyrhynchos TaxID=8839 RepID=R0L0S0_ANAPL|nr:hypothetical protein Anapl_17857 [Anas platyrhynchos]